jgi:hypothetical protein
MGFQRFIDSCNHVHRHARDFFGRRSQIKSRSANREDWQITKTDRPTRWYFCW